MAIQKSTKVGQTSHATIPNTRLYTDYNFYFFLINKCSDISLGWYLIMKYFFVVQYTSVHALMLTLHLSWPPLDPWDVKAFSRLREPSRNYLNDVI